MHIVIVSPSDKSFIAEFLSNYDEKNLPNGFYGAPFIGTIIKELLAQNYKVTAITTTVAIDNDYCVKSFSNDNFTWVVVPSRPRSVRMNGYKIGRILDLYYFEIKQLTRQIQIVKPDFVHAHWSYEFAAAAIKAGFPFLVTVHDNAFQVFKFFKKGFWFGRLLMAQINLRKIKYASTVSPYMESYVKSSCEKVEIIPNPVAIDMTFVDIETALQLKVSTISKPKIIMINNGWDMRKNGLNGLLAFKQIKEQLPEATLHLFGHGSEQDGAAFQDVQKLKIENVFFYGAVPHSQLIEILRQSHFMLHPALEESFGVVLIEAQANGVPVIGGMYSGAVPWVIDNPALLVNVENPNEISTCALELLGNKEAYKEAVLSGYKNTCNRFSTKEVVEQYINYYELIIGNWNS
ncbi:MAG: glycosyltransferase family 4 protein [Flavobacterium sp.]|nr:glycosyltransferase family 4 protein [Flavobacterium sp.]